MAMTVLVVALGHVGTRWVGKEHHSGRLWHVVWR